MLNILTLLAANGNVIDTFQAQTNVQLFIDDNVILVRKRKYYFGLRSLYHI